MALNPSYIEQLEVHGLTNLALEQLLLMLGSQVNGSVTWHFAQGEFRKFEIHHSGSMQNRQEMQQAMQLARR